MTMNYEDRYNEALKIARDNYNVADSANINVNSFKNTLTTIFPELKEKTDKEMIQKVISVVHLYYGEGVDAEKDECLKWLEKQIIKPYSRTSFEYNNHTWGICARDNGIDIFYDSNLIKHIEQPQDKTALDNQSEQKQEWSKEDENEFNHVLKILNLVTEEQKIKGYNNLISSVNWLKSLKDRIQSRQSNKPQGKSALEAIDEEKVDNANKVEPKFKVGDIVQYITDSTDRRKIEEVDTLCNMYHTDSSPIMFEIEDEWKVVVNAEDVEQELAVEPKFNVGDWIVRKNGGVFLDGRKFAQITKIEGEKHWFDTAITYPKGEDIRHWTLEDAEDGDILYSKKHNLLWCYKNTKECYCCINLNYNSNNISIGNEIVIPNDVRPATQEQRDLLFNKMLQHTFSEINENKVLKKQGEWKSVENTETKFKVGDWVVVSGEVILICDIHNSLYDVMFADGEHRHYDTNILDKDKEAHLWTIDDAKDGDILVASDGSIFIFAGVVDCACKYYAALTVYNGLSINKEVELGSWEMSNAVHPATKEQCDHLFKVMKEKGYKWYNEKKELIRRI